MKSNRGEALQRAEQALEEASASVHYAARQIALAGSMTAPVSRDQGSLGTQSDLKTLDHSCRFAQALDEKATALQQDAALAGYGARTAREEL